MRYPDHALKGTRRYSRLDKFFNCLVCDSVVGFEGKNEFHILIPTEHPFESLTKQVRVAVETVTFFQLDCHRSARTACRDDVAAGYRVYLVLNYTRSVENRTLIACRRLMSTTVRVPSSLASVTLEGVLNYALKEVTHDVSSDDRQRLEIERSLRTR